MRTIETDRPSNEGLVDVDRRPIGPVQIKPFCEYRFIACDVAEADDARDGRIGPQLPRVVGQVGVGLPEHVVPVPLAKLEISVALASQTCPMTKKWRGWLALFHGPPLSGKSLVIRRFAESLPDDHAIAVVDGAGKDTAMLFQEILGQFGYDHGFRTTIERFNMVRVFAMQQAASVRAPLLIIENAHAMSPAVLESLCELAELNVRGKEALRIVPASPRSLPPMIEAPAMQSISRRVTSRFLLQPLTRIETADYIYKKLSGGGCRNPRYLMPQAVCDRLSDGNGITVRLEGHADERGSREYNIGLGERRSQAVSMILIANGVPASQLSTISFGEERPAALGSDEQSYARNRRVEINYSY